VLTRTARLLGTDADGLSELALAAPPGAGGLTLLPYFDGERSPNRPDATGVLNGITSTSLTRENMARAAVEAVLCSLADGIDNLAACGIAPERVVLIGGAARSAAVRSIAPAVFGVPVTVPDPAEYVAIGAARQAAWALSGASEPPDWPGSPAATFTAEPRPEIRDRYATLRDDTAGWHERSRQ
jgi:xylulokinase